MLWLILGLKPVFAQYYGPTVNVRFQENVPDPIALSAKKASPIAS
jgi:hypothetical protein